MLSTLDQHVSEYQAIDAVRPSRASDGPHVLMAQFTRRDPRRSYSAR
jgi:hypothetical protein